MAIVELLMNIGIDWKPEKRREIQRTVYYKSIAMARLLVVKEEEDSESQC